MDMWDNVKDFVLSPFSDPNIESAVVLLIIPFFVNVSQLKNLNSSGVVQDLLYHVGKKTLE